MDRLESRVRLPRPVAGGRPTTPEPELSETEERNCVIRPRNLTTIIGTVAVLLPAVGGVAAGASHDRARTARRARTAG